MSERRARASAKSGARELVLSLTLFSLSPPHPHPPSQRFFKGANKGVEGALASFRVA